MVFRSILIRRSKLLTRYPPLYAMRRGTSFFLQHLGPRESFTIVQRLRLNVSPIPVQIVDSRGASSSYAVLKKFDGLAW